MANFKVNSQRAALTKALLDGHELSIMSAFSMLAVTNLPRECGRSIIHTETGFGAILIKKKVDFKSIYGKSGFYYTYKLDRSSANKKAIELMQEYLSNSGIKPIKKPKGSVSVENGLLFNLDF